jgi:hypothetical protein
VVKDESWITTRYLFVECQRDPYNPQLSDDESWSHFGAQTYRTAPLRSFSHSLSSAYDRMGMTRRTKRGNIEFIILDSVYCPVWLNNQALQIPKRDFAIISTFSPSNSSSGKRQFQYDHNTLLQAAGIVGHEASASMFDALDGDTDSIISDEDYSDAVTYSSEIRGKGKAKYASDDDDIYDSENECVLSDGSEDMDCYDNDCFYTEEPPPVQPTVIEIEGEN